MVSSSKPQSTARARYLAVKSLPATGLHIFLVEGYPSEEMEEFSLASSSGALAKIVCILYMGYLCDCRGEQRLFVYCRSDAACLCLSCDRNVHSANALSRRHSRTLVCERCNSLLLLDVLRTLYLFAKIVIGWSMLAPILVMCIRNKK